jgi:four helix bundle protein
MTPEDLRNRTKTFAVDIVQLAKRLPKDSVDRLVTGQLARSATATAAAYRAVCRARSRADFIYKLGNAIEEADESALWLEILADADICRREVVAPLLKEAEELTRIFVRSRETAKARRAEKREPTRR